MNRNDVRKYEKYLITYKDSYNGRIAEAIRVSFSGAVTLKFKNGKKVVYHATWLAPCVAKEELL